MYTVNYTNFFEFGIDAGDAPLSRDGISPTIQLSIPIRFLEVPQSTLNVRMSDMYALIYMYASFTFMTKLS